MILTVLCRTVLALTATTALSTAMVSSAFASKAGPPKLPVGSASSIAASAPSEAEEKVSSLIVKPRAEAGAQLASALQAFDARGLSKAALTPVTVLRPMSGEAYVVKLDQPVTVSEARVIAARLMHNDPSIEYAEPDSMMHPLATTPTDPDYATKQWHYFKPVVPTKLGGANLPDAWDITKGSPSINVAVLDTGYRQHVDFGPVLPGFDFLTNVAQANDGDGRDADAQDPGDWVVAGECDAGSSASDSSWHGTHVAGTIAALMNNGQGGTGIAPNVKILPVRVLGKCGGRLSDIVDGMRWAAGLSVVGVPANPPANVAHVLNMSLGGSGACGATFQAAVTAVVNAGKVIAAATGNDGAGTIGTPANCNGAIAVTAHVITGDNADYANVGAGTAISAPGGGCGTFAVGCSPGSASGPLVYSTLNSGLTAPAADSYAGYRGTSMATPHVAGVAALMFSRNPTLTPAQIRSTLRSSARPHPTGTYCLSPGGLNQCGSGLLDAQAALTATPEGPAPPTVTVTNASQVVAPTTTVLLSGTATAGTGRSISSYAWSQLTGATVTLTNRNTANATFTAPATGTYTFQLTATDNGGLTGSATATVRVNSPPVLTPVAAQTVTAGQALTFIVRATDADGNIPIFVAVSLPPGATLSATGTFNWPNATPVGNTTLTYFARDNDANSSQGTVDISVVASAPAPPPPPSSDGGGGGCTLARTGSGDPLLAALFLLSLAFFGWSATRRRK